jgi:hypothetical protein
MLSHHSIGAYAMAATTAPVATCYRLAGEAIIGLWFGRMFAYADPRFRRVMMEGVRPTPKLNDLPLGYISAGVCPLLAGQLAVCRVDRDAEIPRNATLAELLGQTRQGLEHYTPEGEAVALLARDEREASDEAIIHRFRDLEAYTDGVLDRPAVWTSIVRLAGALGRGLPVRSEETSGLIDPTLIAGAFG